MQRGVVLAAVLLAAGCGKLNKEDARAMLEARYYEKDDNAYCSAKGLVQRDEGGSGLTKRFSFMSPSDAEKACIGEMTTAGIVRRGDCITHGWNTCDVYAYTLGAGADFTQNGLIQFTCGKRRLGDVVSISTEDKKAIVKYGHTVVRDEALGAKLPDCALDGAKPGEYELTRTFRKDDDGKWAPAD
jgi:hypothetical protein